MIRPEFRWWLLTLAVVAVLVTISLLALDRPDVAWDGDVARCPHCRTAVEPYASRCPDCQQQFDWVPTPDAKSPLSPWSLSALEADHLRERVQTLGEEEAARRVSLALAISEDAATRYLASVGRGRCGWCGGTGEDLDAETDTGKVEVCPVCLGRKWCIACGGDRRMRRGDRGAGEALNTYTAGLADVSVTLPLAVQRSEARRLNEAFIARHPGTVEATYLVFWPEWRAGDRPRAPDGARVASPRSAVEFARRRLDHVWVGLAGE